MIREDLKCTRVRSEEIFKGKLYCTLSLVKCTAEKGSELGLGVVRSQLLARGRGSRRGVVAPDMGAKDPGRDVVVTVRGAAT